jgi:glycosyltransferase involved in cell wall biosynthesis
VLTVADSLIFIDELVKETVARGFEVVVVTSPDRRLTAFGRRQGVRTVGVEMPRKLSPFEDWAALEELHRLFQTIKPEIVHAHTPKGGLLGTLAARAVNVPVRIYHMRGLPFVTLSGPKRQLLQTTERLACSAATRVFCQSESLRKTAVENTLVSSARSEVILRGSNGVDSDSRFVPGAHSEAARQFRERAGVPPGAVVVGFIGRLVRDKGVPELVSAFEQLAEHRADLWLFLAGAFEERDGLGELTVRAIERHPRIKTLGFVSEPGGVYEASDIVALPSHREGFPNVLLEAAAMRRPVVSTLVDGCRDAVEDGTTGALVPAGDIRRLAYALAYYADNPGIRVEHGAAGRLRVERLFRRDRIAAATVDAYERELSLN